VKATNYYFFAVEVFSYFLKHNYNYVCI